jgi:predicted transcriptional regulator
VEFVRELNNLGVNSNVARLIAFLKDQNERSSRDIEVATGLRQPEVSIAMRTLRERNWLSETEIKSSGKGRPLKIYALKTPLNEIIDYYEAEKNMESARAIESIQKLREMTTV